MGTKKRRKRKPQNNMLVLKLLILVVIVLILFEGKLIYTMFTQGSSSAVTVSSVSSDTEKTQILENELSSSSESTVTDSGNSVADAPLAGLSVAAAGVSASAIAQTEPETEDPYLISEEIDSPAVVKEQTKPVDDSYFSDAVFIGDSRMEGFRNSSGITQGTFLTSVGLSSSGMSDATIASPEGNISVYQGLSGIQYNKIYLMLGTNDLGYYPWEDFLPNFEKVIQQFHKLQPDATIYICSVIYVEEAKVSASYNNNENVRKINGYLLEICETYDYCYYLNLNEIFTNGYGSLIEDASSDGIHLYEFYCKQMLGYLKTHYADQPAAPRADTETGETSDAEYTETDEEEQ